MSFSNTIKIETSWLKTIWQCFVYFKTKTTFTHVLFICQVRLSQVCLYRYLYINTFISTTVSSFPFFLSQWNFLATRNCNLPVSWWLVSLNPFASVWHTLILQRILWHIKFFLIKSTRVHIQGFVKWTKRFSSPTICKRWHPLK